VLARYLLLSWHVVLLTQSPMSWTWSACNCRLISESSLKQTRFVACVVFFCWLYGVLIFRLYLNARLSDIVVTLLEVCVLAIVLVTAGDQKHYYSLGSGIWWLAWTNDTAVHHV